MFALIFFFLALAGTLSGDALPPRSPVVYRDEDPKQFWWTIAAYLAIGCFALGYALFLRCGHQIPHK
ncbi:MAG: hypothetical protein JOZ43_09390 [Acidobacteriales bacterium]|nr:hypothetical protein [Terriglobales bacterium]